VVVKLCVGFHPFLHTGVLLTRKKKKNDGILKYAGKCRKMNGTRRNHSEQGNPNTKRQTWWYLPTHMWILDME
ncbi:hypothetical protein ACQP3L_40285, partial [Escherichia coli]